MNLASRIADKLSRSLNHWSHRSIIEKSKGLQVQVEELRQCSQGYPYKDDPKLSIILQFFNKRQNIKKIVESLRLTTADEIIVIDDGSVDGSYEDWMKYLDRPNDFLLRCNDIFEVRAYDRAIRMARGEFVCLLQDDDIPPLNNIWVEQALTLFNTFPKLIVLGGRDGMEILIPELVDPSKHQEYYQWTTNIMEWPGVHKLRLYNSPDYLEPTSGISFMFTMTVNRAPTFIRKKQFLEIGGINQNYAPFQIDDDDACVRAWLAGYQVGFYPCSFVRNFDVGGMTLFNSEKRREQVIANTKKFYAAHSKHIADGYLQSLVNIANSGLTLKK